MNYELTFGKGPLGLILAQNKYHHSEGNFSILVEDLTGVAKEMGQVCPNDLIVKVNGNSLENMDFQSTLNKLKQAERPITLRFWRAPAQFQNTQARSGLSSPLEAYVAVEVHAVQLLRAAANVSLAARLLFTPTSGKERATSTAINQGASANIVWTGTFFRMLVPLFFLFFRSVVRL